MPEQAESPGPRTLRVSSPGRVCLFGEHQDYLGLPVIPAAISLRISIEGRHRDDRTVHIDLPDIGSEETFTLDEELRYRNDRDYFRSGVNVMRRNGSAFSRGIECTLRGNIPINAGTSSSSALSVSWVNFLARMSDQAKRLTPEDCARFAVKAEVEEFREPGGMMDQYAASYGGLLFIDFMPTAIVEPLPARLGSIVLGDSLEGKDTKGILARVKGGVLEIVKKIQSKDSGFRLHSLKADECDRWKSLLDSRDRDLLLATVRNHEMTRKAKAMLLQPRVDDREIGKLLTKHHVILHNVLKISTRKIDAMLDAAMGAGAYGGKINGSGGGGCMFAYAPGSPEKVAAAIERAGGKAYILAVDGGTRAD